MAARGERAASAALFVVLVTLSALIWRAAVAHHRELLRIHTATVADQAAVRLVSWFEARLAGLSVMTEETARSRDDAEEPCGRRFFSLATAFLHAQPGLQAINWVDSTGVVRRVVPEADNPQVKGSQVRRHPEAGVREAFALACAETTVVLTKCVALLQGGHGVISYWPVVAGGRLLGFVSGTFRIEESVRAALASGVLDDFRVELREDDRTIFRDDGLPAGRGAPTMERQIVLPHGHPWRLSLTPRAAVVARYRRMDPYVFLALGFVVPLLLAGLAREMMRRAGAVRAARDEAVRELAQRRRLEVEKEESIRQLEQANAALGEINRELDAYIYAASHDVRAPLVAVAGLVDILLDPSGEADPAQRQHIIARIRHNIQKLDTLVQDMLVVSRSRRLERTSRLIDIAGVCEEAWASVNDLGGGTPMEFALEVEPACVFRSDPLRFRQIVNNLLSNAVKYRDPRKTLLRVEVRARLAVDLAGRCGLELTVRDNGIGVPEASVPRIFDMFYKASNDSFGSGLGLYILRQHCLALGGEAVCNPLPDGTEFVVTLPGDPLP